MTATENCPHADLGTRFKVVGGESEVYIVTYCTQCGTTIEETLDTSASNSPVRLQR